jgi:hypothetical protein
MVLQGFIMMYSDLEDGRRDSGRSRDEVMLEAAPTLRQNSRFRAPDDEDVVSGGLRHAAGVWRQVAAKRRKHRKA